MGRFPTYRTLIVLFLVLKLGLALALLAGNPDVYLYGDGREYVTIAQNLWNTGSYVRSAGGDAEIFRLPGYPVFLLPFGLLGGTAAIYAISVVQIALVHLWLWAVAGWIARRFGAASAAAFVVFLSLSLTWIHYPATVHSDALFAVLVFGAVALMLERRYAWSAAALAVATLTRPDLLALPVWLIVSFAAGAILNRSRPAARRIPLAGQAVGALAVAGAVAGWTWRNGIVGERFTYSAVLDYAVALFRGGGAGTAAGLVEGAPTGSRFVGIATSILDHLHRLAVEFVPALGKILLSPGRWYLHRYENALGLRDDTSGTPIAALRLADLPAGELAYIAVNIAIGLALLVAATAGFWRALRGRVDVPAGWVLIAGWVLLYFLLQKGVWGAFDPGNGPRYAMSTIPFLAFFAALNFAPARR